MAVVIGFLTLVLVGITAWYARLTRRMALTMEHQLRASFQPDIGLKLDYVLTVRGTGLTQRSEEIIGSLLVTNKGNLPVKIVALTMKVIFESKEFSPQTLTEDTGQRVVAPGQTTVFRHLTLEVPLDSTSGKYEQVVQIHCSDLAGVSQHTFSLSSYSPDIINQSMGFQPV